MRRITDPRLGMALFLVALDPEKENVDMVSLD